MVAVWVNVTVVSENVIVIVLASLVIVLVVPSRLVGETVLCGYDGQVMVSVVVVN